MLKIIDSKALSVIFFLSFSLSFAQNSFEEVYHFSQHLKDIEAFKEGAHFLGQKVPQFSSDQQDSLYYLKGLFHYELKEIPMSISAFNSINRLDEKSYAHAKLLSSFQLAYEGSYDDAKFIDTISFKSPLYQELSNTLRSGIALLERDFDSFDLLQGTFSSSFYQVAGTQKQLQLNYTGLQKAKKKSPGIAGVMSAIIPGSGKFYVGKVGQGYTTLLISTILALQSREAYKKDGLSSTRFKIFSGIFGLVYIANIWGSVVSVKTYQIEVNETYDQAILLNMHVPLRTIFD